MEMSNHVRKPAQAKAVHDVQTSGCKCRRPMLNADNSCVKCGEVYNFPSRNLAPLVRRFAKVGRNDTCPCKSGKKWKRCHGVQYG